MAEGTNEDNNSWESWLGGWVQAAKEKSNTAYEFVKRDLAEFSTTVQKETEKAIEKTSSSLTRENTEQATTKVKAGISSFLGNISKALVIPPSDDYVPVKISADGSTLYDREKARLHAIQLDASTYVDPPRGSQEQYEMWLSSFDMDQHKGEISEILVSKVEVRALYTKLVPNEVSHAGFWQRYFYRVHQLQCDETRKQALMQRADRAHRDSLSWDDDDWSGAEDEDDGNQSDWEKMPRPQHTSSCDNSLKTKQSSSPAQSTSSPYSQTTQSSPTDGSQLQDPTTNEVNTKNNNVAKNKHHGVSLPVASDNANPCDKDSASFSTETDSGLETVHNHFSAHIPQSSSAEASDEVTSVCANKADSVSNEHDAQISADTASACTSEEHMLSVENVQAPEPGSSAVFPDLCEGDVELTQPVCHRSNSQNPGASSAAAASGIEMPLSPINNTNAITGDAACGASDILSSSYSTTVQENETLQALDSSSASKDIEDALQESNLQLRAYESQNDAHPQSKSAVAEQPKTCDEPAAMNDAHDTELPVRVKGDMVVVGGTGTPSSDSSEPKELDAGLDDEWDEDFDVEVTEEDLKAAEDIARKLGENLDAEDDWENWD